MLVAVLVLLLTAPVLADTCDTWQAPPQQIGRVPPELKELWPQTARRLST